MTEVKQIIVLSGGGHKGVVRLADVKRGIVSGSCNLDFRPVDASLYLVGDEIAQIRLYDMNSTFEVPFLSKSDACCVLRSRSLTMFGGRGDKAFALSRVDRFSHSQKHTNTQPTPARTEIAPHQSVLAPKAETVPDMPCDILSSSSASTCDENMTVKQSLDIAESVFDAHKVQDKLPIVLNERDNISSSSSSFSADDWTKYDGTNFYYAVKPQLDEMFVRYPRETQLEACVQNSSWVQVDAPDGGYAVGILFDGAEPAFICYAVSAPSKTAPPRELDGMCVWLPAPSGGYWVIYQSAKTGEIIK